MALPTGEDWAAGLVDAWLHGRDGQLAACRVVAEDEDQEPGVRAIAAAALAVAEAVIAGGDVAGPVAEYDRAVARWEAARNLVKDALAAAETRMDLPAIEAFLEEQD